VVIQERVDEINHLILSNHPDSTPISYGLTGNDLHFLDGLSLGDSSDDLEGEDNPSTSTFPIDVNIDPYSLESKEDDGRY